MSLKHYKQRLAVFNSLKLIRIKDRSNPFEDLNEAQFKARFRFEKNTVIKIIDLIKYDLKSYYLKRGVYIPLAIKVLVALRYYATGSFQLVVGDIYKFSQGTVSIVVNRVSRSLAKLRPLFIKFPTFDEAKSVQKKFYKISQFPVCNLMREGVVGIFGPSSSEGASHTQGLCDRYDIPHVETSWDYKTRQDKYLINLFPHPDSLALAYSDLVNEYKWEDFVVIYDDDESLFKIQELIKKSTPPKRKVLLRQLPHSNNYRILLKDIQRNYGLKNITIDCGREKTLEILRQAQQLGMTNYEYSYILTTLDMQDHDLDDYKHGEARFIAFRMVDPNKPEIRKISQELFSELGSNYDFDYKDFTPTTYKKRQTDTETSVQFQKELTTNQALVYDAVRLFSKSLERSPESIRKVRSLECEKEDTWTEGSTIINNMRAMSPFQGLTGIVQFNNSGYRTDISLDVIELTQNGLTKVGVWEYARRFSLFKDKLTTKEENEKREALMRDNLQLANRTLRVTTIMNPPFCMYKRSEVALTDNNQFEGFSIDLVELLSQKLFFKYKIQLVADETYPGMIREVKENKSDMVVADLTVTKVRQQEVDFTMPFMNLGISILYTTPKAKPPSLFSFMSPFALEVWIYMAIAFFGVSFVLFIIARLTPYEWDSPHPCITDPDVLHNQFSLSNSFWFTIGSIMQQGSDLAPKAVSTRMIAGIWWFFTLIMVSSYTANLATFLIVQELEDTIKNLDDLASQTKIQYGCLDGGSTMNFFKDSNSSDKRKIYDYMVKHKSTVLKSTNKEGIDQVQASKGKYAFFMENTLIEYNCERICGLAQVGGLLDNKGYGVALPKDSPFLDSFNGAVLKLQEEGKLDDLKRKWWKEERKEANCIAGSVSDSVNPLQLANVGGVFVVLVVGCITSFFITCLEFLWKSRELQIEEGGSRKNEILEDLQFALQCRGNVKPVKKLRSSLSVNNDNENEEMGSTPYIVSNSSYDPPTSIH